MRKSTFESNIKEHVKMVEEIRSSKEYEAAKVMLEGFLENVLKRRARDSDTTVEAQEQVLELQFRKREVMKRLSDRFKNLDNPFFEPKTPGQIGVVLKDGKYFAETGDPVTVGQILTDGDWGLDYHLDPASVPRRVRKRFYLEEAKRELMKYFDLQIIEHESSKRRMDYLKKEGYQAMKENLEETGKSGVNAEKMVSNFLRRLVYDYAADFSVMPSDAYEDMEQKVDFIIKYKPSMVYRGVGVEEEEKAVGIQFTINPQPDVEAKKAKQVARARERLRPEEMLKDIVLVVLPLSQVSDKVHRWRMHKTPGGPEETWSAETKRQVLRAVLGGIVPQEEIERLCGVVKDPPSPNRPLAPSRPLIPLVKRSAGKIRR